MLNSRKIKLNIVVAFALMLCGCRHATNSIVVDYIKSKPLREADFAVLSKTQHLDSAGMCLAIKRNVLMPQDQDCGTEMPVYGRQTFKYGQIENSLTNENTTKALTAYIATLYKLIAEPVELNPAKRVKKNIDYYNRALSCQNLFDSLATSAWDFDCGGHAEMAKVFLDTFGHQKYTTKVVNLSRLAGDEVTHIVALAYYRENGLWFGIVLDCQNGMLGPIKKGKDSIPSIYELQGALEINQTGIFEIRDIPMNDLRKKRNLMNEAFYCNVLVDKQNEYHLAYAESGYKYERLTYSLLYSTWFKSGFIDQEKYKQNLIRVLLKNAPQN